MNIKYAKVAEDGIRIIFFGETVQSEMIYPKVNITTLIAGETVCVLEDDLGKKIIIGKVIK